MQTLSKVSIVGTGFYVPERVLSNADLERMVDTSDEWIVTRTGIRERRLLAPGQATSDMAAAAGRRALENAGVSTTDLDLIVVGTFTPDRPLPSCACLLQSKLGAKKATAFDLSAACSGFVFALDVARSMIATGNYRTALIVGTDSLSSVTDYTDRSTCVLFGDAAGAAVLQAGDRGHEILYVSLGSDGDGADTMTIPAGGSMRPASHETVAGREHFMKIKGREVFKFVVLTLENLMKNAVQRCGLTLDDIALLVPHQMNLRIIEAATERLGFPMSKVAVNIERFGNTSAASIPIALDEASRNGHLKKGDIVVLAAFGGGLTWGSAVIRW